MALADNLTVYYPLDEASGSAIDAHSTNDLSDTNTVGTGTGLVYAAARDFELGNSEWFELADNAALSTGDIDFTWEAWVNIESTNAVGTIVGKWGGTNTEYLLYHDGSANRFTWLVRNAANSGNASVVANNFGAASLATWYHIVAWHDATNNQLGIAINAGTADTTAHSGGVLDGGQAFRLGASGFGDSWDGLMGPVGLWKRVLTSAERTELYNAGAGRDYAYITGGGGATYNYFTLLGVGT